MSEAIRRQLEHERRLATLGAFLAAFQASQGAITAEEIAQRACASAAWPATRNGNALAMPQRSGPRPLQARVSPREFKDQVQHALS